MKVYLGGVQSKTYREIMSQCGIKYGCLDYSYIYSRTPKINIREVCELFEEVMVVPGRLYSDEFVYTYVDFLNEYADCFSFAIEAYRSDRMMLHEHCEVDIIPMFTGKEAEYGRVAVTRKQSHEFLAHVNLLKLSQQVDIHGYGYTVPFSHTMNSSIWMAGSSGWTSVFTQQKRLAILDKLRIHERSAIARKLIKEGWEIDLLKIKQRDWKEIGKLNCIAWRKYQDYWEA